MSHFLGGPEDSNGKIQNPAGRHRSSADPQDLKGDRSAAQFCEDNLDRNSSY